MALREIDLEPGYKDNFSRKVIEQSRVVTERIHLVQSNRPLIEGHDQLTLCGKTVKCAAFGAMIEDDDSLPIVEDVRWSTNVCTKCTEGVWRDRFIYAVRDGSDPNAEWTQCRLSRPQQNNLCPA
jgi:hypothetical protein